MFRLTSVLAGTVAAICTLLSGSVLLAGETFNQPLISFVAKTDQTQQLILADLDRDLEVALLHSRTINAHSWSADGSQVAIMMVYSGQRGLHLLDMASGDVTFLLATARGDFVRWSDDSLQVSFLENPYWRRVDLRTNEEVTFRSSLDENRSRSPDGQWTASVASNQISNNTDIILTQRSTRDVFRLTNNVEAADTLPRWSPDGRWLAFQRSQRIMDRRSAWYVVPVTEFIDDATQGESPVPLPAQPLTPRIPANNAQLASMPASPWSADSMYFLFTLADVMPNQQTTANVYIVRADGTHLRQITNDPTRDDMYPVWRP